MHITHQIPLRVFSHNLWGFSLLLRHGDAFPFIRGYEFTFEKSENPSIETLQQLLPNKNIQGTLDTASLNDVENLITEACSWYLLPDKTKVKSLNNDLIWSREKVFWSNLNRYQTFPPDQCFIHKPAPESFFAQTMLWSFCFILTKKLENNMSHGLLLYGKTWQDSTSCPPESPYEALWRKNNYME